MGRQRDFFYHFAAPEEAVESFDQVISLNRIILKSGIPKGYSLAKLGLQEEAVEAYDRAIAMKPEYADSWFHKGFALNKLGKNQEAIASFKKFLAYAPPEYASQGKEIEQIIAMLAPFAE